MKAKGYLVATGTENHLSCVPCMNTEAMDEWPTEIPLSGFSKFSAHSSYEPTHGSDRGMEKDCMLMAPWSKIPSCRAHCSADSNNGK